VAHTSFQRCDLRSEGAKFAFHSERAGFIGPAAGDHAALVSGAVRRDESVLRIFAREFFRADRVVGEIRGAQPRQKLFRGWAERIAEFDELVEASVNTVFGAEGNDGLVLVDLKIFCGVDEEGGASADFFS